MRAYPLKLPEPLRDAAEIAATDMGVSLNRYITLAVAAVLSAETEAARRAFRARNRMKKRKDGRPTLIDVLEGRKDPDGVA